MRARTCVFVYVLQRLSWLEMDLKAEIISRTERLIELILKCFINSDFYRIIEIYTILLSCIGVQS